MYELTTQLASLEPAPSEMERLIVAVAGNKEAMNGFTRMMAGTNSPTDFFAEENVERILAADTGQRMREGADPGSAFSKDR